MTVESRPRHKSRLEQCLEHASGLLRQLADLHQSYRQLEGLIGQAEARDPQLLADATLTLRLAGVEIELPIQSLAEQSADQHEQLLLQLAAAVQRVEQAIIAAWREVNHVTTQAAQACDAAERLKQQQEQEMPQQPLPASPAPR